MFEHLDAYAGDPILSLNEDFQKDPRPNKINLSIGIYFDDAGRIPVMDSVRRAEQLVVARGGPKPYLPIEGAGLQVNTYPYYDPATGGLKFAQMLETLRGLPARSVVLLHACCHNPTGVDLTPAQWAQLVPVLKSRQLLPFLDIAYQGYGDGIDEDAFAIRALADAGVPFFCANSFSKSMSLYGERAGGLSVCCPSAAEAQLALGQLKATVRRNYSSPSIHAGGVVATVLDTPALRESWVADVNAMRTRIKTMRKTLHGVLSAKVPGRSFDYFLTQRGMFSYTGLSAAQVDRLREEFGVYLIRSGRMCVAGLNTRNVEATANAIAAVL